MSYEFDRFLRYDELTAWLHELAAAHPDLVTRRVLRPQPRGSRPLAGHGHRRGTGAARHQAGALGRRQHPRRRADRHGRRLRTCSTTSSTATPTATRRSRAALATRTFYVVPRVNPDGAEWALADPPRFRRSSTRPWPWTDAHRWPGAHAEDVDGDGRVLQMRIADPDGAWMPHPDDARLLVPVPPAGAAARRRPRYRLLDEGDGRRPRRLHGPDPPPARGPRPQPQLPGRLVARGVTRRRRPPAVRAGDRRPRAGRSSPGRNVCGYNAFHTERRRAAAAVVDAARLGAAARSTCGRGSSSARSGHARSPATRCTPCSRTSRGTRPTTMSGAADDWAYEHLGVFSWTTEFWDAVDRRDRHQAVDRLLVLRPDRRAGARRAALGRRARPRPVRRLVPVRAPAARPGRARRLALPRASGRTRRRRACRPRSRRHAAFAVAQALASPCLRVRHTAGRRPRRRDLAGRGRRRQHRLAADVRVGAGRRRPNLVRPIVAELAGDGVTVVGGPARLQLGQLEGASAMRFSHGARRHARPACWRRGSSGPSAGDDGHGHRPPRPRRDGERRGRARRGEYLTFRIRLFARIAATLADRAVPHRCPHATAQLEDEAITDHPRGRRRVRAPGAAVLRRQGLRRHAPPRPPGVLAGADPVPGDARRHRPQLRRGHRVP